MIKPYSIKIFFPNGDPEGLRIIEKSNWTGVGIVVPRALFKEMKNRKELERTGVYVLTGPSEVSELLRVYIGEGDPILPRLKQHAAKKDFWTRFIAFTSKDENLNKAHVQYLEARLIELAQHAKRCMLDNSNQPVPPSLSEADAADAEGFLQEMLPCFSVLGLSVFSSATTPQISGRTLYLHGKGVEAKGREISEGFVVLAGSRAVKSETPSCHAYMKELRKVLIENGVLEATRDGYLFTQDYVFASPSTAAGVVLGRAANGRTEWKTKSGKTLKTLQEEEAAQ